MKLRVEMLKKHAVKRNVLGKNRRQRIGGKEEKNRTRLVADELKDRLRLWQSHFFLICILTVPSVFPQATLAAFSFSHGACCQLLSCSSEPLTEHNAQKSLEARHHSGSHSIPNNQACNGKGNKIPQKTEYHHSKSFTLLTVKDSQPLLRLSSPHTLIRYSFSFLFST